MASRSKSQRMPGPPSAGRGDFPELSGENRAIWNANAAWWEERIGGGNDFQQFLVEPASEELLAIRPGERVLDIGCGGGRFACRVADLGARVVAFDHAEAFVALAHERSGDRAIDFRVIDAGDDNDLDQLSGLQFDKAVCTMALMDMPDIQPLFKRLPQLLRPDGAFVFTVSHPCFSSGGTQAFSEMTESLQGRLEAQSGIKVTRYLTSFAKKTEGIVGQPQVQYMFHRPLSVLLGYGFQHGFVVDGLLEPRLPIDQPEAGLNWRNMPEIPPLIAVRMRNGR
jgi:SAM-dependent methyltransferase